MSRIAFATLALASALALVSASMPARADGAIALGLPTNVARDGVAVGWAVGMTREKAESAALEKCKAVPNALETTRALCRPIQSFSGACVSIAMDPGDGTPGFGWAVAPTKAQADAAAMNDCKLTAGSDRQGYCAVGASECDKR